MIQMVLIAFIALMQAALPGRGDESLLKQQNGYCLIAAWPGLLSLPPGVTAVEFSYDGVNVDSLLGKPLNPAVITAKVVYGDSESVPYEKPDVKGFRLNGVDFSDLILRWRISRLAWLGPCSQDSVFKQLQPFGKRATAGDATSQAYRLYFPNILNTEKIFMDLRRVRGIRWAGFNRKYQEQIQNLDSPRK